MHTVSADLVYTFRQAAQLGSDYLTGGAVVVLDANHQETTVDRQGCEVASEL
jgi:hypothetical protein